MYGQHQDKYRLGYDTTAWIVVSVLETMAYASGSLMPHSNSVNKWEIAASVIVACHAALECCFVCTHLALSRLVKKLYKYLNRKKKKGTLNIPVLMHT